MKKPRNIPEKQELENLIEAGCTIRQLVVQYNSSSQTVLNWLRYYDLKTNRAASNEAIKQAELKY